MGDGRTKDEDTARPTPEKLEREHARLTDELRETSALLEAVLNAIPDIIGIQDLDHRVLRYNEAGYAFLEKEPEAVIGRRCYELMDQEDACAVCASSQAMQTGLAARVEKYLARDGLWLDVRAYPITDAQGRVVQVVEHIRDITQERRYATDLGRVRDQLDAVLSSIPYPLFAKDSRGRYLMCNPAFEAFFGIDRAELIGKTVHECWPSEDARVYHRRDLQLMAKGETQVYEHRLADAEGEPHDIIFTKACFKNETGEVAGIVGTLTDITERKRMEADLRQAQKMETVGQLAGGVAHDFNNLLSPILGYAEMLLSDLPAGAAHREELDIIRTSAERAKQLTQQLLAFSRRQVLEVRPLDPNRAIQDFERMIRRTLRENIEIVMELGDDVGCVEADPIQLDQVLMNLAVNAQYAMPAGGRLTITTRQEHLSGDVGQPASDVAPGWYVVLEISDDGHGIDPDTMGRIFEPFFTTKESGKGTGLGLATVYGIVKQHGGHILVDSQPGHGTTFQIRLPRVEPVSGRDPGQASDISGLGGAEHVVVAEDDPMVRDLAVRILERLGYQVRSAASGQACLDMLSEPSVRVDLLLTDVIMPDLNGRELFERLVGPRPDLKVVFMSGYTDDVIARHGVEVAGSAYLQKPFTVLGLARMVRSVLDR